MCKRRFYSFMNLLWDRLSLPATNAGSVHGGMGAPGEALGGCHLQAVTVLQEGAGQSMLPSAPGHCGVPGLAKAWTRASPQARSSPFQWGVGGLAPWDCQPNRAKSLFS